MFSFMQLFCIIALGFVSFVICTQEEKFPVPSFDEQFQLEKRVIDENALSSIPSFRASNLGMFIGRKRIHNNGPQHVVMRRKEPYLTPLNENILAQAIKNDEQYQRRFDDYSESSNPIFSR